MGSTTIGKSSAGLHDQCREGNTGFASKVPRSIAIATAEIVRIEFEITWRMLADNALASFTPGVVLVIGVCLRQRYQTWQVIENLGKECLLASCYTYVFDAVNQARAIDEDRINKPYRPIPRGLLTPTGAIYRFWTVMAVYSMAGWWFGVLEWVSLWQFATIIINIWCRPRQYIWCKTVCIILGVGAQLAQAWQLVAPIDETGQRWISFMAICFPPALIFEDVRDMAGDSAIGRRTPALVFGELPIRIWFSILMTIMPALANIFLFDPAARSFERTTLCIVLLTTVCWTAAVRSLWLRTVKADRVTYQLFIFSYVVVLCTGCILWA